MLDGRQVAGDVGGHPLRNLYYDFQTLIGGVLAIIAAWWTIGTMEKTDAEAARRHAETMALGLRREYLELDRALNPQLGFLKKLAKVDWPAPAETDGEDFRFSEAVDRDVDFSREFQVSIRACIERSAFKDAQWILDGPMSLAVEELKASLDRWQTIVTGVRVQRFDYMARSPEKDRYIAWLVETKSAEVHTSSSGSLKQSWHLTRSSPGLSA